MRARCAARTVTGKPCRNYALDGSDKCNAHVGAIGRKTLLDDDLADRLVAMLRAGNYIAVACKAAGIAQRTYREWMGRGRSTRAEDAPYRQLRERVEAARAESEARLVTQLAAAARDHWQAAAWMLEREYPERWGRVSVRYRDEAPPPQTETVPDLEDPFREVDELAEARRRRAEPS